MRADMRRYVHVHFLPSKGRVQSRPPMKQTEGASEDAAKEQ